MVDLQRLHGVSFERARQIEKQLVIDARQAASSYRFAGLDAVVAALPDYADMPVAVAEAQLAPQLGPVTLAGAARVHQLLHGLPRADRFCRVQGGPLRGTLVVGSSGVTSGLNRLASVVWKLVQLNGAVSRTQVLQGARASGLKMGTSRLLRLIEVLPGIVWLDDRHLWMTAPSTSWLATKCKTILAVAHSALDLRTLYMGLEREARRRHSVVLGVPASLVPKALVPAFLTAHDAFRYESDGRIRLMEAIDAASVLTKAQLSIVREVEAQGGKARWRALIDAAMNRGNASRDGAVALIQYAGYLQSNRAGAWMIRGYRQR